jgi:Tetracyclin repressor-like, C-terminal domain
MELALRRGAEGCEPVAAIRRMASAYINFAKDNKSLYEAMMGFHVPEHDSTSHESLWAFTVEQVQRLAGSDRAAQASVALWAYLHGAVTLEAAQVLGEVKPASGLDFGFEAWLMVVSGRRMPVEAHLTKPTRKAAAKKVPTRERPVRGEK